jgi:DNA-binding protein H-NS
VSSDKLDNLSVDEIQSRLNDIANNRAALERALNQRRQQTRKELAQEVREMILSRGHDLTDILDLAANKKRAGSGRPRQMRSYARYVDPANAENVYVRGVLPGWMREQMVQRKLDPKVKEDRETFKAKYLQKQGG